MIRSADKSYLGYDINVGYAHNRTGVRASKERTHAAALTKKRFPPLGEEISCYYDHSQYLL